MEVEFATPALRNCYEKQTAAAKTWGPTIGRKYVQRVNLLLAARQLGDLTVPKSLRLHPLHGQHDGQYAISLDQRWRLVFRYERESGLIRIEEVTNHYGD